MNSFRRNKESVHFLAETAYGLHYNNSRLLRRSMFISWIGSDIALFLNNREPSTISNLIKTGIIVTYCLSALKSLSDTVKEQDAIDKYNEIFKIIKRPINKNEDIQITYDYEEDTAEEYVLIEFEDKSYIKESIAEGKYACLYTNPEKGIVNKNITKEVNKVLKKTKE